MSATRKEREMFIAEASKLGIHYDDACKFLRYATTLQRLSEAQCNGDWPADDGDRPSVQCKRCESAWDVSAIRKRDGLCVDCRTEDKAREVAKSIGLDIQAAGDPRGWVMRIMRPLRPEELRTDYPVCGKVDCLESERHQHFPFAHTDTIFAPRWAEIGVPS